MSADPFENADFEKELEELVDKAVESDLPLEDIISALEDKVSQLESELETEAADEPEEPFDTDSPSSEDK